MPDKSNTESAMQSDDLFGTEIPEKPRMKRQSLEPVTPVSPRPEAKARQLSPAAEAATEPAIIAPNLKDEINSHATVREPAPIATRPTFASTAQPSPAAKSVFRPAAAATPASGTLYYSTGARPEKEKEIPMNPTPASSPTSTARPATSPTASAPTRPASSTVSTRPTASPAAAATRPPSAVDYRANLDRQAKEQKSMGGVLAILVYTLLGLFILGAGLAGFGVYALSKQIRQQSLTIGELDKHYAEQNQILSDKLKSTGDDLTQAEATIGKQQQTIQQQQAALTKITATAEQTASSLQAERQTRAGETASLRARLRSMENRESAPASH